MKNKIFLIIFLLFIQVVYAQQNEIDSLMNIINRQRKDTNEVIAKINLVGFYLFINPDSAIIMGRQAVDLARTLNYSTGEANALSLLGECLHLVGDFPQALECQFNALRISREIKDQDIESNSLDFIGIAYVDLGEYRQGLTYLYQAKKINDKFSLNSNKMMGAFRLSNIGHAYEKLGMRDSALFFQQQAQILSHVLSHDLPHSPETALILTRLGVIQSDLGNQAQALIHYRNAIHIGDVLNLGSAQFRIAELFYTLNQPDSSLYYARLAFINNHRASEKTWLLETSNLLVKLYKAKNKIDSAFHYQEVSMVLKDSLFGPEKFHRLQLLAINEQQRQQEIIQRQKEIQHEKEKFENNIKMVALLVIVGFFLLLAIILYRNNRQKQYTNVLLQQQKEKVESTLSELKSTQAQLIQSEKMASLGELTAGIAHEIQNPLNFVNNFSEVNREMLEELKTERLKPKAERDEQAQDEIINDVIENEEKINHHGKRADAIVKGMLQHSRANTGKKEPTDINALADEYLRLSYHGMRAKDKSFNVDFKTDFDQSIGKINIVPQDIGRVMLNLFNNAFYAVNEKKQKLNGTFVPAVNVSTKKENEHVIIKVTDNGNGIPQKVIDKIFQPFFTTKPTGEGTGLGLSLSYDIIKAHGGEIKVETKESEGSEFIVQVKSSGI
jgi:two-component system NtrC family sensor kinase